jgi:hypothetical protein
MPAIQALIENERQDFEEMPSWSLDAARLPKFLPKAPSNGWQSRERSFVNSTRISTCGRNGNQSAIASSPTKKGGFRTKFWTKSVAR